MRMKGASQMTRYRNLISVLCLALVLTCTLAPRLTRADDGSQERPIHLYATATPEPIGAIYSLTPFVIAGRLVYGGQTIWGGELIQAPTDSSVRVQLDSIGQVTIANGAAARLARRFTGSDGRSLLIASLVNGHMSVDLLQNAGAYIESSGSVFKASSGAHFRVGIREGRAIVDAASGEVQIDTQAQQRGLKIRLVEPNPDPLKPPIDLGLRLDVEKRTTRETQWQVTDEHDKPVPDIPLILTVTGNVGRFGNAATFSGTTNAQGIVNAPFTAGSSPGNDVINARIPGTDTSENARVTVKSKSHSMRNRILIGAGVLATTLIVIKTRDDGPIEQSPPPTVIP